MNDWIRQQARRGVVEVPVAASTTEEVERRHARAALLERQVAEATAPPPPEPGSRPGPLPGGAWAPDAVLDAPSVSDQVNGLIRARAGRTLSERERHAAELTW